MFNNQGNQRKQQQGFVRSFNAFPAPDSTQNSEGSMSNPRIRNNPQQVAFGQEPSRRGGLSTARRGVKYKGTGRGRGRGGGNSLINPNSNRENSTINRAFDDAFSDVPSHAQKQSQQQIRRKPRTEHKMANTSGGFTSTLDSAISDIESKKGGQQQKHAFTNKPTRFNPHASPFVSQKTQQHQVSASPFASQKSQQQQGTVSSPFASQQQQAAFGNSPFMNQNNSNDQFRSPFIRNNALDRPNTFAQQQSQTSPFYSGQANISTFGSPSPTPFITQQQQQQQQQQQSFSLFSESTSSIESSSNFMDISSAEPSPLDENPPQLLTHTPFASQPRSRGIQQRNTIPKRTMGDQYSNEDTPFSDLVQKKKELTKPNQQQQSKSSTFGQQQKKNQQTATTVFGQQSSMNQGTPSLARPFISNTLNKESQTTKPTLTTIKEKKTMGGFNQPQQQQGSPFISQVKKTNTSVGFNQTKGKQQAMEVRLGGGVGGQKEKKTQAAAGTGARFIGGNNTQPKSMALPEKVGKNKAADRAIRFGSTEKTIIYDNMKQMRIIERQKAIDDGLIPDPNAPTTLDEAIDFRGSCETMCPEFEIIERDIQNNIDPMELNENGEVDLQKMVKAYRRSAAGNEQPLPCDVRSAEALTLTLNYLINDVLTNNGLESCHGFIRDRTRSIRQDFTRQNIGDVIAVQVFERIARFHILCLHEMCELDEAKFSQQQEMEQLRKVLISLIEFYDDLRLDGIETENEAEFRAYHIIVHFRDQDVVRQTMTLPLSIFKHAYVDIALQFHSFAQRSNEIMETPSRRNKPINVPASQNFYTQFFKLVSNPETPFLMACLLESHFSDVRKGALKAMNVSYVYKLAGVPASDIQRILCYDSLKQLLEEAILYGLVIDNSLKEPTLRFGQKHYQNKQPVFIEPLTNPPQKRSFMLVEPKKEGRNFKDIINYGSTITPQDPTSHRITPFSQSTIQKPTTATTTTTVQQIPAAIIKDSRVERFEAAKAAADAATAAAALERQKMEAAIQEKKIQQEQVAAAMKQSERLKEIQKQEFARQQAAVEVQKQKERARLEEATRLEEEQRKRAEKQMKLEAMKRREQDEERMRKKRVVVDKDRIARSIYLELMGECVDEQAKERVKVIFIKQKRAMNFVRRKVQRWLANSRARIQKQNKEILTRKKMWIFSKTIADCNPGTAGKYDCLSRRSLKFNEDVLKNRASYAIAAESCSIDFNVFENQKEMEKAVWKKEELNDLMYSKIRELTTKVVDEFDHVWTNLIYCDPSATHTQKWFSYKFGFDSKFNRKITSHHGFNVINKLITSTDELYPQLTYSIKAITMVLPEKRKLNELHDDEFWKEQRNRLDKLIAGIKDIYPNIQVPVLVTYFPDDTTDIKEVLLKIPKLLGFYNELYVTDYHLLIMDPKTISTRIVDEMLWLSASSVI